MEALTQNLLHELFDYKDNQLYWKLKPSNRVDISKPAGTMNTKGYVTISINGKKYYAHRLVFLMHHGYLPQEIDHINGNKSNNAVENLRPVTRSQNMYNTGKKKYNKSGFKGVSWYEQREKWLAQIRINGKSKFLGYFDCPKKAHSAYCEHAKTLHKDYANFG